MRNLVFLQLTRGDLRWLTGGEMEKKRGKNTKKMRKMKKRENWTLLLQVFATVVRGGGTGATGVVDQMFETCQAVSNDVSQLVLHIETFDDMQH